MFTKQLTFPALFVLAKELRIQGAMVYNRVGSRADFEIVQDMLARDGKRIGETLRHPPLRAGRHRRGLPHRRRQDDGIDQGDDHGRGGAVTAIPIQRLTHVGICVSDLERSLRFYRDLLGFAPEHELEVEGEPTDTLLRLRGTKLKAVYLARDGVRIELLHFASPPAPPRRARVMNELGLTHLSFRVADLDAVVAALRAAGRARARRDDPALPGLRLGGLLRRRSRRPADRAGAGARRPRGASPVGVRSVGDDGVASVLRRRPRPHPAGFALVGHPLEPGCEQAGAIASAG